MPLTDVKLRALKPADRPYKVSDGEGLFVLVNPVGSRLWRLAYRFAGKQKLLALGGYPEVSLRDARKARDLARELLEEGRDPAFERKIDKVRQRVAAANTFEAVAREWFDRRQPGWAASYAERLRSRLEEDLLPALGSRPISEIEAIEVLEAVRTIEARGAPEMARRVLQMASGVFRYAVATGRCLRDPVPDLKGALAPAAAAKSRTALPAKELAAFLSKLERYSGDPATRLALQFILLTFVRSSELRFARWAEFEELDGAHALWRVPPERMKMRRPHLVPLAPLAVAVLEQLRGLSHGSEHVFPAATKSGVISENTLIYALYRLGYHHRATVHGFRSLASTVLNEQQFNRDWIEMQLAHVDGSVRSAYNAAEWLPGRRKMMVWWANHLEQRGLAKGLIAAKSIRRTRASLRVA